MVLARNIGQLKSSGIRLGAQKCQRTCAPLIWEDVNGGASSRAEGFEEGYRTINEEEFWEGALNGVNVKSVKCTENQGACRGRR